jgi:DNA-binding transcriptional LysR family regulator
VFELYQLRYFLAVVETGSFTKAAKRVRVSQPTLSAGVQKLEAALGVALFDRSSRRVFLTSAGTRFVDHARAILSEVQRAQSDLEGAERPRDVLQLGLLTTIAAQSVERLLRDFLRSHPGTIVELFEGTERELKNRLDAGQLDLALTLERPDKKTQSEVLYEEGYSVAIAAHHPLAKKPALHVTELAEESSIVRTRCEVLSETSRFFTRHNVRPRLVYRTDQDERALRMVGAGVGITVMPDHYRAPGVARIPLEGFDERRKVALVHAPRGKRKKESAVERFSEFAASQSWSRPA